MKHLRFDEESAFVDVSYASGGDGKRGGGIAKHFAESLEQYHERKKWFDQLPVEPTDVGLAPEGEKLEELRREASSALHAATLAYEHKSSGRGSSDLQWARALVKRGAIADRVAAATVLIQESPIHNVSALRALVASVKPAKKKDGIVAIDALSELFVSELLPTGQKLRPLESHALGRLDQITSGDKQTRRNTLALWQYEHELRDIYAQYVEALNTFASDSVQANREKAVTAMSYLLMHHPEKEKILLANVLNKLGDPASSVASKVVYQLCQLLYNHPNMKKVVLAEIERLLFRPNVGQRAQYYAICFLNQFHLERDDEPVAEHLVKVYFAFFRATIKKGEVSTRLMRALLTGVKRAYPFADASRLGTQEHVRAVQRLVHLASDAVAVRALALLYHISSGEDSFYTALYRKMCSPELVCGAQAALFLSVAYKSLRRDDNAPRVSALLRRLTRLAAFLPPAPAAGILLLLSQVTKDSKKREALRLSFPKHEVKEEPENEPKPTVDGDEEVKSDDEQRGVSEMAKSEVKEEKKISAPHDLLKGDKRDLLQEDSEEEYCDVALLEDGREVVQRRRRGGDAVGWHHKRLRSPDPDAEAERVVQLRRAANADRVVSEYNPYARNPAHAGALLAAAAELRALQSHFHPTVRLFAQRLANGELLQYSGDPLKDFSGARFLERFAFKNPKKRDAENTTDGAEGEEGLKKVRGSHPKFAVRKNYTPRGLRGLAVTSTNYLSEDAARIPLDERFLYDYLRARRSARETEEEVADSDAESVGSEDFDEYLDSLTGTAKDEEPELDFESEVLQQATNKKGSKPAPREDDEASLESEDALSEEDIEPSESGDEDELALEHSDEDEKPRRKGRKSKGGAGSESLFANADEFAELLDEAGGDVGQGSSQAASRADGAGPKQLHWEQRRHQWIKGYRGGARPDKRKGAPPAAINKRRKK